jgi:hypothetical protein
MICSKFPAEPKASELWKSGLPAAGFRLLGAAERRFPFFARAGSLRSVTLESRALFFLAMRVGVFWRLVRKTVGAFRAARGRALSSGREKSPPQAKRSRRCCGEAANGAEHRAKPSFPRAS